MQQNELYDVVILGASPEGIALGELLNTQSNIKVALISKDFKNISNKHKLENIKLISGEVILINYFKGLISFTFKNNTSIFGKKAVIAVGSRPIKSEIKNTNICYKPADLEETSKTKPVVIFGNNLDAANYAIELSKKFKYVYLCTKEFKLNCDLPRKKKIANLANVVHLPGCKIMTCKNDKIGKLQEVTLDTYDTIRCSALIMALGKLPDTTNLAKRVFDVDQDGYIITKAFNETTKVPNLFAIGACSDHNTKQSIKVVYNALIK